VVSNKERGGTGDQRTFGDRENKAKGGKEGTGERKTNRGKSDPNETRRGKKQKINVPFYTKNG